MVFENTPNPIFKDRNVFSKRYIPKSILHRGEEIKNIESCLSYILNGSRPTSQLVNGMRGSGKTLVSRYVTEELCKVSPYVKVYYIGLRGAKTEFKAIEEIIREVAGIKIRGLSFRDALRTVFDHIKTMNEQYIIFILDEIDEVQDPDTLLYCLLRYDEIYQDLNNKEVVYIFITNDMKFPQNLSPGTASSWTSVDKHTFALYSAPQLRDILEERAIGGLQESVYDESILRLCAAYGAQERGDARETIKLLEKAAELALKSGSSKITEQHVQQARIFIESDGTLSMIRSMTVHLKSLALACIRDHKRSIKEKNYCMTGTVYTEYKNICSSTGIEPLSQRRISDLLDELEWIGFIEMRTVYSRGKTRHVNLSISVEPAEKALLEDSRFESLKLTSLQTRLI